VTKEWEQRALTESLQPPESSIDIDIAAVAVAAMAEALVGIDLLIAADGVGICTVISLGLDKHSLRCCGLRLESINTEQLLISLRRENIGR
jgi:hypothetical protein